MAGTNAIQDARRDATYVYGPWSGSKFQSNIREFSYTSTGHTIEPVLTQFLDHQVAMTLSSDDVDPGRWGRQSCACRIVARKQK